MGRGPKSEELDNLDDPKTLQPTTESMQITHHYRNLSHLTIHLACHGVVEESQCMQAFI